MIIIIRYGNYAVVITSVYGVYRIGPSIRGHALFVEMSSSYS